MEIHLLIIKVFGSLFYQILSHEVMLDIIIIDNLKQFLSEEHDIYSDVDGSWAVSLGEFICIKTRNIMGCSGNLLEDRILYKRDQVWLCLDSSCKDEVMLEFRVLALG